ncbi:MAG: FAD-dependent oxidoreductase [Patescibacteria group bacterium]|nr:FAD-dependent oxidoreductase [Patescibacteria group bacterium]MDD3777794.1 FAD-dependent oxidoreductase [Patescibacteria group bacterium]MDD3939597.1 FAD-dependent oxidoreductase [Patescibacteria group bacterium]MDD4443540.1 FAD-dependent oxidoreductase [Patescibacteria group bacterium]
MYDLIIIGSGPAGMTAGMYAVRREMKTLIIGKELGGQLVWASEIENYPGFESIKSFELISRIKNQAQKIGVEFKDAEVKKIERDLNDGSFRVFTTRDEYRAKTIIVTMGLAPRRLAVPGEVELSGRGVSYCANCDGPFYRDRKVAIIGGGNSALDAAEYMSKVASEVYLVHRSESFRAFDILVSEVMKKKNINIYTNTEVRHIVGEDKVEKIIIFDKSENKEREIAVDGVFIEIGRIASTDLLADFVERDEKAQIIAKANMETKTPGIFAAGDVVSCEFKQITIAMGQATIAALSAYQYIQMNEK